MKIRFRCQNYFLKAFFSAGARISVIVCLFRFFFLSRDASLQDPYYPVKPSCAVSNRRCKQLFLWDWGGNTHCEIQIMHCLHFLFVSSVFYSYLNTEKYPSPSPICLSGSIAPPVWFFGVFLVLFYSDHRC